MKVGHIYESGEFSFFSGMNPSRKKYYYSPYSKEVYTLGYHPYFDIDYSPDADGWKEDTTDSNLWVRNSKVSERTVKNEDLARQRHETVIANGIYRSSTESRYSRLEDIHVYSPYEGSLVNGHLKVVDTDPMTEGSIVTLEMNDTSHIVGILTPAKQIMFCENIIIGRVNSCGDLGIIIKGQLQPVEVTCDEEREPSFVDLLGVID